MSATLNGTYSAPPGPTLRANSSSAAESVYRARAAGSARREDAKMSGITPVAFTLNGRYDCRARFPDEYLSVGVQGRTGGIGQAGDKPYGRAFKGSQPEKASTDKTKAREGIVNGPGYTATGAQKRQLGRPAHGPWQHYLSPPGPRARAMILSMYVPPATSCACSQRSAKRRTSPAFTC
jgi:hypothetical protein